MLDIHVTSSAGGSANLTSITTIPSGDGASNAGISPFPPQTVVSYAFGGLTLNGADGIKEIKMLSNNVTDPSNGLDYKPTGTSTKIAIAKYAVLPYLKGANTVQLAQAIAGAEMAFLLDNVAVGQPAGAMSPIAGQMYNPAPAVYSLTAGGALTAQTYRSDVLSPTSTPPPGKYAILGAWVTALTNSAIVRFLHGDFGGASPGFPVSDFVTGTNTVANLMGDGDLLDSNWSGYQFVRLGQVFNQALCPVFRIQGQGTGLSVQAIDNSADTPTYILNLQYLGQ